mmetsp:Transcript_50751/g.133418  ORF Transcript_50751/g.133418 Transcript_50751/m.133418 type:complete len:507 (+) Transcript_50751:83-1603(+)
MPSRKVLEQKRSSNQSDRRGIVGSSAHHDINDKIIASFERGDIAKLLATIASHLPRMNLVNMITALHRLAKLTSASSQSQICLQKEHAFQELLRSISTAFDTLEPGQVVAQSLSNLAWSMSTLNFVMVDLLSQVVAAAVANLSSFKAFELAMFLQACSKLSAVDNSVAPCTKPVFEAAAAHILARPDTFETPCLANVLWALVSAKKLRDISATLLAIAQSFGGGSGHAPCRADTGAMDGCTNAEVPTMVRQLFEVAVPWLIPRLLHFSATSLTSLAEAFAMMRTTGAQRLIGAVHNEASKRYVQGLDEAGLYDCLESLSMKGWASPTLKATSPNQTKSKVNSKRRVRRACHTSDQTVYAGYSNLCHADPTWTTGLCVVLLPPTLQQAQNHFIEDADVGTDGMTVPWPASKAESIRQPPPLATVQEERPPTCLVEEMPLGCSYGGVSQSPLVGECQPGPDIKWNCSVKNSFLQVEIGYDSDSFDDPGRAEGGSFRRSRSVPSRFDQD